MLMWCLDKFFHFVSCVASVMWAVPLMSVISLMLNAGPSFSYCTTTVSVQDLGCHMHWTCSDVNTTTFTVQTKIQGGEWENVSHCVQISSSSCNLSEVFTEFDLYKFVKLGLNQGHGIIYWTSTQLCEQVYNPNASFSPPSLSLSVKEQQLWVEVIFPNAPYAACQENHEANEEETPMYCPITNFVAVNTTTRTEMVHGTSSWKLQFVGFTPGQEYCAVAQFESSPSSTKQCLYVPLQENSNLLILALSGVFLAALLIVGFVLMRWWCWCASTDLTLPKSLMSLQDQEGSVGEEPREVDFEEEESFVHLSIISLNNMLPSDPNSIYPHLQTLRYKYYTTTIPDARFGDGNEDTDYYEDIETDGVGGCVSPAMYPWPRWSSLPALRTGMVCFLGNFLPLEGSEIPLSSVRVAQAQVTKIESDHSFKVCPTLYVDD